MAVLGVTVMITRVSRAVRNRAYEGRRTCVAPAPDARKYSIGQRLDTLWGRGTFRLRLHGAFLVR